MGLGSKISRAFSRIGQKVQNLSTNIGNKTHDVIRGANKIAKGAVVAYDKAKDFVGTLPELNEKAIRFGNTVIDKSGQATNVLRQASGIANTITSGLAALGGDIPVVGSVLKAGAAASNLLAKGAQRIDEIRDNAAGKLNKYEQVSRDTIEKINPRKKLEIAQQAEEANNENNVNNKFV